MCLLTWFSSFVSGDLPVKDIGITRLIPEILFKMQHGVPSSGICAALSKRPHTTLRSLAVFEVVLGASGEQSLSHPANLLPFALYLCFVISSSEASTAGRSSVLCRKCPGTGNLGGLFHTTQQIKNQILLEYCCFFYTVISLELERRTSNQTAGGDLFRCL